MFELGSPESSAAVMMQVQQGQQHLSLPPIAPTEQATLPPVVICPTEVDNVNITLEKNQQCACKDCGKLFNSVWYLKQHAVKHSNDRPFRCKFCLKTYKFRSNLYQHKCPDRIKNGSAKRLMSRGLSLSQPQIHDEAENAEGARICVSDYQQQLHPQQQQQHFQPQNYVPNVPTVASLISEYTEYSSAAKTDGSSVEEKPVENPEADAQENCLTTRKKPLDQAVIDDYIQRNKHKLYPCRKCRIQFPSREYLSRHTVYHTENETLMHKCSYCPQRYATDKALQRHLEVHSTESNFVCKHCAAPFRSMLALRRHKDRCRECTTPPLGCSVDYTAMPASSAIDEYAFIDAQEAVTHLHLSMLDEDVGAVKGPDSGLGSEGSNHSYTTSPARSSVHLEDDEGFEADAKRTGALPKLRITIPPKMSQEKKKKEDDEEPGLRSRYSSITQSGSSSGISNFSSDGASPTRRMSMVEIQDRSLNGYSHYNGFITSSHGHISSGSHTYASDGNPGQSTNYSDLTLSSFSSPPYGASSSADVLVLRPRSFTPYFIKEKPEPSVAAEVFSTVLQRSCDSALADSNLCAAKWILYRRFSAQIAVASSISLFANLIAFVLLEVFDGLICANLLLAKVSSIAKAGCLPSLPIQQDISKHDHNKKDPKQPQLN